METLTLTRRQYRTVVGLLGAIAALLLALVAGLGIAGIWGVRTARTLAGSLDAREVEQRQASFEHELAGVGTATLDETEKLASRREALSDSPPGPMGKLDRTVRLNQLMADELLVLLRNLSGLDLSVAHGARPLPQEQRRARAPARR